MALFCNLFMERPS